MCEEKHRMNNWGGYTVEGTWGCFESLKWYEYDKITIERS